jgi:hypothetical protein
MKDKTELEILEALADDAFAKLEPLKRRLSELEGETAIVRNAVRKAELLHKLLVEKYNEKTTA